MCIAAVDLPSLSLAPAGRHVYGACGSSLYTRGFP